MKRVALLFVLLAACLQAFPQSATYLVGCHFNGSNIITRHLNLATYSFTDFGPVVPASMGFGQAQSAYDPVKRRYYMMAANSDIPEVDALTGTVLKTLTPSQRFGEFKFESASGKLIGLSYNSTLMQTRLARMDFNTGNVSTLPPIAGMTSYAMGETALDEAGGRLFVRVWMDTIFVIDITTGAVSAKIHNPSRLKGLEFDAANQRLLGSFWTGSAEFFATLDLSTGNVSPLAMLAGVDGLHQGITAFDASSRRYFCQTNLGTTIIDANTGSIIAVVQGQNDFANFEYAGDLFQCGINAAISPPQVSGVKNGTVVLNVNAGIPSATFQWQTNPANTGWINLANNGYYSNVNTSALTVSNLSLQNHLQPFRVIVSAAHCSDTSNSAVIMLSDTCIVSDTLFEPGGDSLVIRIKTGDQAVRVLYAYPNPAALAIEVHFPGYDGSDRYTLRLSNSAGVAETELAMLSARTQVDVSRLSAGVYYLQVVRDRETVGSAKVILRAAP